jgi:hypothetical protein
VKTYGMRRRWIAAVALLAMLGGVGSVVLAVRASSGAGGGQPSRDLAFVHAVKPALAHAAALTPARSVRALSLATDATAVALFAATLWALLDTILLVPAGWFVRPSRRRRAPPLLVA